MTKTPGQYMAKEAAEAPQTFIRAVSQTVDVPDALRAARAIYTVARGSSDAAANVLS